MFVNEYICGFVFLHYDSMFVFADVLKMMLFFSLDRTLVSGAFSGFSVYKTLVSDSLFSVLFLPCCGFLSSKDGFLSPCVSSVSFGCRFLSLFLFFGVSCAILLFPLPFSCFLWTKLWFF